MCHRTSLNLAALLGSLSLILMGCRIGNVSPTATPTPSPTALAVAQPGVESIAASPTLTATSIPEIAPLSVPPYPEPKQGPVVTKEPPLEPGITPTEATSLPTTTPTVTENFFPPPYPGEGTPRPEATDSNPPPYPITTETLQPTATLSAFSPTPTLAGSSPTATSQPERTPPPTPLISLTPTSTPTTIFTPTITPTPRPRIEPRQIDLSCSLVETTLRCEDDIIGYSFSIPAGWVLAITGNLRPGETGVQYGYDLQRANYAQPVMLQIGGISRDFVDGREELLTDFAGFQSESASARCEQFQGAQICEPISAEILLVFLFPEAERLCLDGPQYLGRPLALIAVALADNELVNGFVFAGDFLSPSGLADYEADLADLLESEELPGEPCDGFRKSRFNVRMLVLVAAVRNEILDLPTLDALAQWRQLGESLRILDE